MSTRLVDIGRNEGEEGRRETEIEVETTINDDKQRRGKTTRWPRIIDCTQSKGGKGRLQASL